MKRNYFSSVCLLALLSADCMAQVEFEPNQTILQNSSSNTFTAPVAVSADINLSDVDFFRIDLPNCGSWAFNLINPDGTPCALKMYLYDNQNTSDVIIASGGITFDFNQGIPNPVTLNCGNTIYVQVDQTSGTALGPYTLSVQPDPNAEPFECNGSFSSAAVIPIDTTVVTRLWGYDCGGSVDRDYFTAIAPQCGVLTVTASNIGAGAATEQDVMFTVFQQDTLTAIGGAGTSGCNEASVTGTYLVDAGPVYIKVEDFVGNTGVCNQSYNLSLTPFDLSLEFDSSDDCECNNTFATACAVDANSSREIKLWGLNNILSPLGPQDRDYYTVMIEDCAELTVTASNIGGGGATQQDVMITVYQPDTLTVVGTAGTNTCDQPTISGTFTVEPGIAYVQIHDYVGPTGICSQSYNLSSIPFTLTFSASNCTGVPEVDNRSGFSVQPNPTTGVVLVLLSSATEAGQLIMRNAMGQELSTQRVRSGDARITIDLAPFGQGIYLLELLLDDGTSTVERVVKN
jgi:hypothetical protein